MNNLLHWFPNYTSQSTGAPQDVATCAVEKYIQNQHKRNDSYCTIDKVKTEIKVIFNQWPSHNPQLRTLSSWFE